MVHSPKHIQHHSRTLLLRLRSISNKGAFAQQQHQQNQQQQQHKTNSDSNNNHNKKKRNELKRREEIFNDKGIHFTQRQTNKQTHTHTGAYSVRTNTIRERGRRNHIHMFK